MVLFSAAARDPENLDAIAIRERVIRAQLDLVVDGDAYDAIQLEPVQDGLDGRSVRQIEGGPALFLGREVVAEDAVQADIHMYHRIILPDRTA
jgi:hypothetical protein